MIFCIVLLVAIVVAHLYGVFFLKPPDPNTVLGKVQLNATPWYMHSFTWTIAVIACCPGWPHHAAESPQGVSPHLQGIHGYHACR